MPELKVIYQHYGLIGIVVTTLCAAILALVYLIYQKRDFFLSKDMSEKQKVEKFDQEPQCCQQRKTEIDQLKEQMNKIDGKITGHINDSDKRVFDFGQFNASQIEINKNVESTLKRLEEMHNKIFELITDLMLKK